MKKRPELLPDWLRRIIKDWRTRNERYTLWIMEDLGAGYLPVPKVASSSIRNAIRERMGPGLLGEDWPDGKNAKTRVEKEIRLSLSGEAVRARRDQLYLFTFVRNPLTRLFSCYRDKVVNAAERREKCTLSPYGIHFGMSFDDFVRSVAEIPDARADQHFCSQHRFVAHNGVLLADYVGKIETFDHDWQPLEARFGLHTPPRNKRVSGVPLEAPALPLSRSMAELAARRYAVDIDLLGYQDDIRTTLAQLR